MKYGGRTDTLDSFSRWMVRCGSSLLSSADGLIPVPLHTSRMRQRRFNQSLLLAEAIARRSGLRVDPHALLRKRRTPSQGGQSAKARHRNVSGAFAIRKGYEVRVKDQRLILIDDVYTTGATLEACARTLYRAGVKDVMAITLSRVVKPVNPLK